MSKASNAFPWKVRVDWDTSIQCLEEFRKYNELIMSFFLFLWVSNELGIYVISKCKILGFLISLGSKIRQHVSQNWKMHVWLQTKSHSQNLLEKPTTYQSVQKRGKGLSIYLSIAMCGRTLHKSFRGVQTLSAFKHWEWRKRSKSYGIKEWK